MPPWTPRCDEVSALEGSQRSASPASRSSSPSVPTCRPSAGSTTETVVHSFGQLGHAVFRRLGELDVPTFAFVNGAAMGGGIELALALHLPDDVDRRGGDVAARGLPRPDPGLGRRLAAAEPHRAGERPRGHRREPPAAEQAAEAQGRAAPGHRRRALRAGRLPGAVAALGRRRRHRRRRRSIAAPVDRGQLGRRRRHRPRRCCDDRIHGATPAPYAALDLVRAARTRTRDEGFAAEDDALADLVMGDELRASLYAFDLVAEARQAPGRRARQVAGPQGHQGRRRRRRADGQPAGPAVRQAPAGAGRDDRPRRGARRQGPGLRARRPGEAGRQGPAHAGQGRTASRRSSPDRRTRPPSRTPTSSSRPCSRTSP